MCKHSGLVNRAGILNAPLPAPAWTLPVLFQSLFRLLSRLPLAWLHRLGGWAGWLTYKASPSYARRLRENLFNALGR